MSRWQTHQHQGLGGASRCGRVLGPSLDKIIKNAVWRKHSHLVVACKSAIDKLESRNCLRLLPTRILLPLYSFFHLSDAEFVLQPLALDSAFPKVVKLALDCLFKIFSLGLMRCQIDLDNNDPSVSSRLLQSVCKCSALGEEAIGLGVLKVLLSAVRSPSVLIGGDCLVHIVSTCYNVYFGGFNGTNQICA